MLHTVSSCSFVVVVVDDDDDDDDVVVVYKLTIKYSIASPTDWVTFMKNIVVGETMGLWETEDLGATVAQLVEAFCYKLEGCGLDS
jgi:hypothetical protein